MTSCAACAAPLPPRTPGKLGRPPKHCSQACRQRGYLDRRIAEGVQAALQQVPADDEVDPVAERDIVALAKALFDVGLTSVGPDDLDNRSIASRLLLGGHVRVPEAKSVMLDHLRSARQEGPLL